MSEEKGKKKEDMEEIMQRIKEIEFATVEEFYEKREYIQEKYKELDYETGRVYKWYFFYQVCIVDESLKSAMWDYVCNIGGSEMLLAKQFRKFKEKKERYHLKYILEEEKRRN